MEGVERILEGLGWMVGLIELGRSGRERELGWAGATERRMSWSGRSWECRDDRMDCRDEVGFLRRMKLLELVFWWTTLDLFSQALGFGLGLEGRLWGFVRLGLKGGLLWDYWLADEGWGGGSSPQGKRGVDKCTQTGCDELVDALYRGRKGTIIRYEQGGVSPGSRNRSGARTTSHLMEYGHKCAVPSSTSPNHALKQANGEYTEDEEEIEGGDILVHPTISESTSDSEGSRSDRDSMGSAHRPMGWMGQDEGSHREVYDSRSVREERDGRRYSWVVPKLSLNERANDYGGDDHDHGYDQDKAKTVAGDDRIPGRPSAGKDDDQNKRKNSVRCDRQADRRRTAPDLHDDIPQGLMDWEADSERSEARCHSHTHEERAQRTEGYRNSITVSSRRSHRGDDAVSIRPARWQMNTQNDRTGYPHTFLTERNEKNDLSDSGTAEESPSGIKVEIDAGERDPRSGIDNENEVEEANIGRMEEVGTVISEQWNNVASDLKDDSVTRQEPIQSFQIHPLRLKSRRRVHPEFLSEGTLTSQLPSTKRNDKETLRAIQIFRSTVRRPNGSSDTREKEEDLLSPTGRSGLIRSTASSTESAPLATVVEVVRLSLEDKRVAGGHRRKRTIDVRESTGIKLDALLAEPWANIG